MSFQLNNILVGKVCIKLDSIDSTQSYLQTLCSKTKPVDGTAILTYHQTNGYGQNHSPWQSEPNANIALSFIVYPNWLQITDIHFFNKAIALAVKKSVIDHISQPAYIKWPNDIIVENKKIAGILIQSTLNSNGIDRIITGIGINVNQKRFSIDLAHAVSFASLTHQDFVLDKITHQVLYNLNLYLQMVKEKQWQTINTEYHECLFLWKQKVSFEFQGHTLSGILEGVDDDGALLISHSDGEAKYLNGQIKLIWKEN